MGTLVLILIVHVIAASFLGAYLLDRKSKK